MIRLNKNRAKKVNATLGRWFGDPGLGLGRKSAQAEASGSLCQHKHCNSCLRFDFADGKQADSIGADAAGDKQKVLRVKP